MPHERRVSLHLGTGQSHAYRHAEFLIDPAHRFVRQVAPDMRPGLLFLFSENGPRLVGPVLTHQEPTGPSTCGQLDLIRAV